MDKSKARRWFRNKIQNFRSPSVFMFFFHRVQISYLGYSHKVMIEHCLGCIQEVILYLTL